MESLMIYFASKESITRHFPSSCLPWTPFSNPLKPILVSGACGFKGTNRIFLEQSYFAIKYLLNALLIHEKIADYLLSFLDLLSEML